MNYIITPTQSDYISDLLLELNSKKDISVLNNELFSTSKTLVKEEDKLYLSSDTLYPLIHSKLPASKANLTGIFRDKYQCRRLLEAFFPDFYFDKINLSDLPDHFFDFNKKKQYVVKPLSGFMAGGVRIINEETNLIKTTQDIQHELDSFSKLYPNIFCETVVIEEYIGEGDEYAVDLFYDENGSPSIVNIYCHPNAKRKEYLQMLYYTSQALFDQFYQEIFDFFAKLNEKLQIKSMPLHVEFKLNAQKKLIPIEFNAYRFGGMGLSDLAYYAFNFHPIQSYFDNQHPDWTSLWAEHPDKLFCWILAYNAADRDLDQYEPVHSKFKELLPKKSHLMAYKELDHHKNPAFALTYLSTKKEDDLEQILSIEFNDCFSKKSICTK